MSCEITFREATAADYDDVMKISDGIYDGFDYLPVRYHDFCKDPQRHMFVAEDDGKVVAFAIRLIIDGGSSNVSQAVRVQKEYAGRGITTSLANYVHRKVKDRYPTLERTVYTTIDGAGAESALKKFPYQKLLGIRPRFSSDLKLQALPEILKSTQFHSLTLGGPYSLCKRQSEDEALASLVHEIPFNQFVPEGMWVVDFEPFGHHVNNYLKVVKNTSLYISRIQDDSPIQAISFLTSVRVPVGWSFRADFYCPDTETNPFVLVAHLLRHLEEMGTAKGVKHIWFTVTYPKSYPGTLSKNLLLTQLKDLTNKSSLVYDAPVHIISIDVAQMEKYLNGMSRL